MSIPPSELLARLSATIRADVGPAVDGEYQRTQAFMASVILERISRELELGPKHAELAAADLARLGDSLPPMLTGAPAAVTDAIDRWVRSPSIPGLGPVVEALYSWGADEPTVVAALAEIRPMLRRDIDRRMEIAR